jgi:hypothetical protein
MGLKWTYVIKKTNKIVGLESSTMAKGQGYTNERPKDGPHEKI